jgi:hypothetical protein
MPRVLPTLTLILALLWQSLVWAFPPMAQERAELLAHEWTHEQAPEHHHHQQDASLHLDTVAADDTATSSATPSHHHHDPAHQVPGLPAMGILNAWASLSGSAPSLLELMPPSVMPEGLLRPPQA